MQLVLSARCQLVDGQQPAELVAIGREAHEANHLVLKVFSSVQGVDTCLILC